MHTHPFCPPLVNTDLFVAPCSFSLGQMTIFALERANQISSPPKFPSSFSRLNSYENSIVRLFILLIILLALRLLNNIKYNNIIIIYEIR